MIFYISQGLASWRISKAALKRLLRTPIPLCLTPLVEQMSSKAATVHCICRVQMAI